MAEKTPEPNQVPVPDPKELICPTCGKLLATTQLQQLNHTLALLLEDYRGGRATDKDQFMEMIQKVSDEIGRVSRELVPSARVESVRGKEL